MTAPNPDATPPASPPRQSRVYVYADGFMVSCDGMVAPRTERYTGTMLFAIREEGIDIEVAGRPQRVQMALLKPFVPKVLNALTQPFVSIGLNPMHPKYRAYTRLEDPGYVTLPRSLFPSLNDRLHALWAGYLDGPQARRVYEHAIDEITQMLPPLRPMDARIERVTASLAHNHRQPLEALADKACLSYYRMSHLFSNEMGLSLRQYVLSLKIHAAARCIGQGMSLTATAHEAGFTDSAHLSRAWTKAFGGPPTRFLNPKAFSIQPTNLAPPALEEAA